MIERMALFIRVLNSSVPGINLLAFFFSLLSEALQKIIATHTVVLLLYLPSYGQSFILSRAMRFENWDVLLFPEGSKVPIQEFKTQCFVTKDVGAFCLPSKSTSHVCEDDLGES
jgi:hypothetical protein